MPLSSCNNIAVVPRQNVLFIALSFIFIVTLFAIFSSTNTSKSKSSSSSSGQQQQQQRNNDELTQQRNNDVDTSSSLISVGSSNNNNDDYDQKQIIARPTPTSSFSFSSSSSFDIATDLPLERIYSGLLLPPFEPISPSPTANPITGDALAEYIRKQLFRKFSKGYFKYYDEHDKTATTKEKGEFKSQTTEFIGGAGGSASSSSSSSSIFVPMASTTNQHWEPLACLDKSTIRCSKMSTVGGPLKEFYPRFNNVSSPLQGRRKLRKKLISSENYQNDHQDPVDADDDHQFCCTVATLGRWTRPFDRHLMADLSREDISSEELIVKRLIWQPPPISSSSSKTQNSFRLDEAKVRGSEENQKYIRKKRNQLQQEAVEHENMMQRMRKLFPKFGETAEAQQLLEELYVVIGRNMNKIFGSKSKNSNSRKTSSTKNNNINDEQMKLVLLLGLSRLKKVNVDVLEPNDDKQVGDDELLLSKRYQDAEKRSEKKRMMSEVIAENGGGDDHENQLDDDNEPLENQKLYTKKTQRAPRIFLTGNSYVRALVSSIAAIFRGQDRYFERGSHRTVRYVVTNVGDYMFYEKSSTSPGTTSIPDDSKFAASDASSSLSRIKDTHHLSINESDINSPHFKKVGRRRRKDSGTSNDAKEDHTTAAQKRRTTKPSSSSTGRKTSSTKTTTRNTISQIMRPIRLRRKNEVVLFEIVYQFQTGMQIRSWMTNNNNKRKEASVPEDFLLESPLLSPEVQQKLFRGSFSAVFMRNFVIHGLGLFHKFFGDGGLKDYCDWQMKTVMKQQQQQQDNHDQPNNSASHEDDHENFYVALHGSPNIQYLWVDRSQTGIYSRYETQIGKASFERARDEIYSSSSSSSPIANTSQTSSSSFQQQQRHARHIFIPKPSSANKGEVFTAVDDLGHTQCIVLPHYDDAARGFRHELEQSPEQRQLITALNVQARANNFYYDPSDCSDVLSRNYWMKFGLGAYLSAKSTKKQFS